MGGDCNYLGHLLYYKLQSLLSSPLLKYILKHAVKVRAEEIKELLICESHSQSLLSLHKLTHNH